MKKPLDFSTLRKANMMRVPLFKNKKGQHTHKDDGSEWSDSQWLQAIVGELGEYANLKKKVERGDLSIDEAKIELGKELADVMIYLDLLAYRLGIDLGQAVNDKFNEVSNRVGADIFIHDNELHNKNGRLGSTNGRN
jgi:NTP pyrophosphatase (non-canonical NTP hydrolase)